jgi:Domain of unknown function (DUF6378)
MTEHRITAEELTDVSIPAFVDNEGDFYRREEEGTFTMIWGINSENYGRIGVTGVGSWGSEDLLNTLGEPFYDDLPGGHSYPTVELPETIPTVVISQEEYNNLLYGQESQVRDQDPPRAAVLTEAASLITGDRNKTYGSPTANFRTTAEIWTALLAHKLKDDEAIEPYEVGALMVGLKLARTVADAKRDSWVDIAGYAGCAWECQAEGLDG